MFGSSRPGLARVLVVQLLIAIASCGGDGPTDPRTGEGGGDPAADGGVGGAGGSGGGAGTSKDGGLDRRGGADGPAADRAVRDLPAFERPQYPDLMIGECKTNDDCPSDKYCSFLKGCSPTSYACQHGFNVYCLMDPGHCKTRPTCDPNPRFNHTICGCDGKNYQNACYMEMAGQGAGLGGEPCP